MKIRSSDWLDVASVVGITLVVWLCYAAIAGAAPVCRIQKVVAQPYIAPLAVAPVYYQVGQSLQREAAATHEFRHSEEYIELQQLRGFKAGVDAVTASGDRPSSPSGLATKGGDNPDGAEQPPASMLKATCAKCHSGTEPKGDIWLDHSVSLEGPDAATKRDAIVNAIRTGKMPPKLPEGERLPPDVIDAIEDEIYGVQVVAEPPTPPQGE